MEYLQESLAVEKQRRCKNETLHIERVIAKLNELESQELFHIYRCECGGSYEVREPVPYLMDYWELTCVKCGDQPVFSEHSGYMAISNLIERRFLAEKKILEEAIMIGFGSLKWEQVQEMSGLTTEMINRIMLTVSKIRVRSI